MFGLKGVKSERLSAGLEPFGLGRFDSDVFQGDLAAARHGREIPKDIADLLYNCIGVAQVRSSIVLLLLIRRYDHLRVVVPLEGLEPTTPSLRMMCSTS